MRHACVAILIACALGANVHLLRAAQSAACTPAGGLSFICGVQNPEDLVLVPNSRWMLASGMAPGSGLHIVDTTAKTVASVYATSTASARADKTKYGNCPAPLDPKQTVLHGLSLRPACEAWRHLRVDCRNLP